MPTRETERQGVGPAAKDVAEHASTLARLELELASLEIKRKIGALGLGIGLALGAAVFLLYALGFGFAAGAVGLALVVPLWAALLIVFSVLVLVALVLGLIGLDQERHPAGARAGRYRSQADHGGAKAQWQQQPITAQRRTSAATSRPSASNSPRPSTTCARGSGRRPMSPASSATACPP